MSTDRTSAIHPLRVERLAEQYRDGSDSLTVQVAIDPRYVLPELLRALSGHAADMLTVRTLRTGDMRWHDALGRIAGDPRVVLALTIALGPSQADDTSLALAAACEASECWRCGRLVDIEDSRECGACTDHGEYLDARLRR